MIDLDKNSLITITDGGAPARESVVVSNHFAGKVYGLFNRFNRLLDNYNPTSFNGKKNRHEYFKAFLMNQNNHSLAENYKKELMMNLIA
jgi:hypothetical protein